MERYIDKEKDTENMKTYSEQSVLLSEYSKKKTKIIKNSYFDSGKIRLKTIINDGAYSSEIYTEWYENGLIKEENNIKNKTRKYFEDGTLKYESEDDGSFTFFLEKVKIQEKYTPNKKEYIQKIYTKAGILEKEYRATSPAKKDGYIAIYYKSGKVLAIADLKKETLSIYKENQQLKEKIKYINGSLSGLIPFSLKKKQVSKDPLSELLKQEGVE